MPTTGGASEIGAWVADEAKRRGHVAELRRSLVGRRIESVRYVELPYENASGPMWPADGFDALDFGLELDLDDGGLWSCTWASPGYNYGLLANRGTPIASLLRPDANPVVWDVTERWRELSPVEITAVTPVWARVEALCQCTIILHSDGGREAILTLGAADVDGRFELSADDVAVFFSTATATAVNALLPGHPDAIP